MAGKGNTKARSTAGTVRKQRGIQRPVDRRDRQGGDDDGDTKRGKATQAGTRAHPVNLPAQHLVNPADRPAKDVAEFGQDSAMGRAAQPEELSPACVFLAAPVCSSYISGSVLEVLGGPTG